MKFLIVVALAIAAVMAEPEADADPSLLYSGLGYGYGLAAPVWGGYNNLALARPLWGGLASPVWGNGLRVIGKREAEAEPEADPSLLYANTLPYAGLATAPLWGGYSNLALARPLWGGLASPVWGNAGLRLIGKREAEAKPEADPSLLYANTIATAPWGGLAYSGLASPVWGGLATPAWGGLASPVWGNAGLRLIGKREAEAEAKPEADPSLLYANTLGYGGLAAPLWGGWGYNTLAARPIAYAAYAPRVWGGIW